MTTQQPKRKPGRPKGTVKGKKYVQASFQLTPSQLQWVRAAGGSKWLRAQIDARQSSSSD